MMMENRNNWELQSMRSPSLVQRSDNQFGGFPKEGLSKIQNMEFQKEDLLDTQ